jgi:hypothetical protein
MSVLAPSQLPQLRLHPACCWLASEGSQILNLHAVRVQVCVLTGSTGIWPATPPAAAAAPRGPADDAAAAEVPSGGAWRSRKHAAAAMSPWPKPGVSVPSSTPLLPAAAASGARLLALLGPAAVRPCTKGLLVAEGPLRGLPGAAVEPAAAAAATADRGGVRGSTATLRGVSCSHTQQQQHTFTGEYYGSAVPLLCRES